MSIDQNKVNTSSPLWPRVRVWALLCVFCGIILALTATGFIALRRAFVHSLNIPDRLYWIVCAALLLTSPALIVRYFISAKLKTKRWLGTPEHNQPRIAQCAMRPQNRIRPQQRSLLLFGLHWANLAARDPESSFAKRLLGILVLIVYAAALLAICAFSVILIGAGIATIASLGWLMILFGLILLIIPAQFIIAIVRRRRADGNLRSSDDDLAGIMAARSRWFDQQRQQPLRAKLISTVICVAILTVPWLRVAVHHRGHSHQDWTFPFFWTIFALYLIWNQFRRPRSSPSE